MMWIQHRVNKISELEDLPTEFGAEIDLRSDLGNSGRIHLAHDAWTEGDDFEEWLKV